MSSETTDERVTSASTALRVACVKGKAAARIAAIVSLASTLSGCFFIWIPGSVVSKISDSVTGSEGEHCVGTAAKVGDVLTAPNGEMMTVKSLSGTSSRCQDANKPIRALLLPASTEQRQAGAPPPQITPTKVGLSLPDGWEQKTPSDKMIASGIFLYAFNRTTDSGVVLSSTAKAGISDTGAFASTRCRAVSGNLVDPQVSPLVAGQVSGRNAQSCEISGALKTGTKLTYVLTVIEGTEELAVLNRWTTTSNFAAQKENFSKLAENVGGL
jgi:hypothetical protein